ncbi:MAG: MFS transporter [Streptomycetaceae bacterium]|nr:MAG: MFS transporter [Streptomycetaceae bacterium]
MKLTEVLNQRYMKRLYASRFISNFGNGLAPIALAFGILKLPDGNATQLGLVLGSSSVTLLLMFPFGGVIADRYGRARLVGASDIVAGSLFTVQAILFFTGNAPIPVLMVINALFGITWGIWWPAFSGILPALLPDESLQRGNAFNQLFSNVAMVLGAATGGILVTNFGSAFALLIDAFSFIVAGVLVFSFRHMTPAMESVENTMLHDIKAGWKVFISFHWIVAIVAAFSFIVMVWAGAESVLGPMISLKKFHGASSWSIVLTCESIGFIVGSLVALKVHPKRPMLFLMLATSPLIFYVSPMAFSPSIWIIAGAAFLCGISVDLWGSIWNTALQQRVPRESLSRVSAYDGMGSMLFRPIGLAIAGPLSLWIGVDKTLYFGAGLVAIAIALTLFVPEVRNLRRFEENV